MAAGAKAADETDAAFRAIIDNDPEIQAVIRSVWGNTTRDERPGNTPKNLEKANARASKQIGQILQRKGIDLPDRTFINPRSGTIEGHRGWSGLSGLQKGAIIAAAAVATGGALGAAGAFGGAAGGAAGGGGGAAAAGGGAGAGFSSGLGVTSGLGGLSLGGSSLVTPIAGAVAPSMIGAGMTPALSAGTLAGVGGGGGGSMGLMSSLGGLLKKPGNISDILKAVGGAATGSAKSGQTDRESGVNYQLLRDKLGIDNTAGNENALTNRAALDLKQRSYVDDYRKQAFQDAMRGSLASNFQGIARPKGVSNVSFLGPNAISSMRESSGQMRQQGMERAAKPATFDPLPAYKPYDLTSPEQMPGASTSEKLAGMLGLGATAAGSMFPDKNQKRIEDLLAELEKR